MTALATQLISLPSLLPQFTAAANGDTAIVGNGNFLVVKNASGASVNVTLATPGTDDFGNAKPDLVVAVAAATERYIPISNGGLADPVTGLVTITYSATASVTVGAFN
jgi:hypothetical protein